MFEILTLRKSGFFIFANAPVSRPTKTLELSQKIPCTSRRLLLFFNARLHK